MLDRPCWTVARALAAVGVLVRDIGTPGCYVEWRWLWAAAGYLLFARSANKCEAVARHAGFHDGSLLPAFGPGSARAGVSVSEATRFWPENDPLKAFGHGDVWYGSGEIAMFVRIQPLKAKVHHRLLIQPDIPSEQKE